VHNRTRYSSQFQAMQDHLCQILAHYVIYLGSKLDLPISSDTERFILEAATRRWEKKGCFLWSTASGYRKRLEGRPRLDLSAPTHDIFADDSLFDSISKHNFNTVHAGGSSTCCRWDKKWGPSWSWPGFLDRSNPKQACISLTGKSNSSLLGSMVVHLQLRRDIEEPIVLTSPPSEQALTSIPGCSSHSSNFPHQTQNPTALSTGKNESHGKPNSVPQPGLRLQHPGSDLPTDTYITGLEKETVIYGAPECWRAVEPCSCGGIFTYNFY